ncbi:MAG: MBOAT family O-acyltransferase [Clostridia bacterium]|nr:MBOAT family O-acyltransferase [Clostridia bacterium]
MLFNSYIFILVFLPLAVAGYFLLNRLGRYTLAKIFLILMSLWFYGYFNPAYLAVIVSSVLANYGIRRLLLNRETLQAKKWGLAAGLLFNIGLLFLFKYYDFFIANVNALFHGALPFLHIALPLGISFFTFQQLSYIIDAYRGGVEDYAFVDYALFVVFFPQLIAGPIVRHAEMIPQFLDPAKKRFDYENFARGLQVFTLGLAKKVLLADTFGRAVDAVYAGLAGARSFDALLAIFAYTMQIYFDFSGYCDMAAGLGLMLNIRIPQNFHSPYRALNAAEFWRRWHMTLGSFFTDYLYIPLGGSRRGRGRALVNVMIVFLVSGLWHGADYTFVLWGALHGLAVVASRLTGRPKSPPLRLLSWLLTFLFINLSWVFFRAGSIDEAMQMFRALGNWNGLTGSATYSFFEPMYTTLMQAAVRICGLPSRYAGYVAALLWALAGFYFAVPARNTGERLARFRPAPWRAALYVPLFVWCLLSLSGVSRFLYFNF